MLDLTVVASAFGDDRPDIVQVTMSVANTGDTAATGLLVTVFVPPGLYQAAPIVTDMATFWTPLETQGNATDGWVLSASYSEAIEANNSVLLRVPDHVPGRAGRPAVPALGRPRVRRDRRGQLAGRVGRDAAGAGGGVASDEVRLPSGEGYSGVFNENIVFLTGYAVNAGRKSTGDVVLRVWWNPAGDDPAWTAPPLDATSTEYGPGIVEGGGTSGDDPWYIRFTHGPTAPRDSLPGSTPEELAPSRVPFNVAITLAANPVLTPKDFYATMRGAEVLEPVPGVHSWQSTLVTPYVP